MEGDQRCQTNGKALITMVVRGKEIHHIRFHIRAGIPILHCFHVALQEATTLFQLLEQRGLGTQPPVPLLTCAPGAFIAGHYASHRAMFFVVAAGLETRFSFHVRRSPGAA